MAAKDPLDFPHGRIGVGLRLRQRVNKDGKPVLAVFNASSQRYVLTLTGKGEDVDSDHAAGVFEIVLDPDSGRQMYLENYELTLALVVDGGPVR